jgi:hypothetical protein
MVAMMGIAAAGTPSAPAPEVAVGSAVTAVGLLAGVLLVMRSRRK